MTPTPRDSWLRQGLFMVACFVYAVGALAFTVNRVQDAIYFTLSAIALLAIRREFLR